jgi:putative sigma-54 modulation protein
MEFRAYFKHMDSSLPLFAYAEKKVSEKVDKFVRNAIEGHITFSIENNTDNRVHFHLVAGGGFKLDISAEHELSMYSAVDLLVDKLEKKLRRHKERLRNHKFSAAQLELANLDVQALKGAQEEVGEEPVDASYVLKFERARREIWPEIRAHAERI